MYAFAKSADLDMELFMHVFPRVPWSQRVNSLRARSALVLHEQTCIAAITLTWTTMILNSSETSESLYFYYVTFKLHVGV